ncbi:MAG: exodeoxyribonuclease V subunit alpha, partial [Vibrionaceae bacterium]
LASIYQDAQLSLPETAQKALVLRDGSKPAPLVFDGQRLYLYRNWQAEQTVAKLLSARAVAVALPPESRAHLDRLFDRPDAKKDEIDWQKVAAACALSFRFAVISGGPGTGKTTTVTKLLAALIQSSAEPPLIKMVAPTGKAANRLTESIGNAVGNLDVAQSVRDQIPRQASTIHRLLGSQPNTNAFRHNAKNPLLLDVLVVDEASMVDLGMMASLLNALPAHARIILLGDRDQLASVEAGSVLADLCMNAGASFSPARARYLEQLTGFTLSEQQPPSTVADGVCLLQKSFRFDGSSGIGQLAKAINRGAPRAQIDKIWQDGFSDIARHTLDEQGYQAAIACAATGYQGYLSALAAGKPDKQMLEKFLQFRLLCALTQGAFGVQGLNVQVEQELERRKLIKASGRIFYTGRPVMVTQNDYGLGLYNGDIGIVVAKEEGLRVVFELSDGSLKYVLPSRLPQHQTAYAMTVHKSQGSEFAHTQLILPPEPTPVMSRELLYTGVTRAKKMLD